MHATCAITHVKNFNNEIAIFGEISSDWPHPNPFSVSTFYSGKVVSVPSQSIYECEPDEYRSKISGTGFISEAIIGAVNMKPWYSSNHFKHWAMRLTLRVAGSVTEMTLNIKEGKCYSFPWTCKIYTVVLLQEIGYILSELTMVFQKGRLRLELLRSFK